MKKILITAGAGVAIIALHLYSFGAAKIEISPLAHKEVVPFTHESIPANSELPNKESKQVPAQQQHSLLNAPIAHVNTPAKSVSDSPSLPPTVNFQMQMAQISQKVFDGFGQAELIELAQAIDSALNEALTTADFDRAIGKLEGAVTDLATAFGKNIEITKNLNIKLKKAINTGFTEFDSLVRSGKISNLTGEIYLARIFKAGLNGLKAGFAKASIMPENTPVPSAITTPGHKSQPDSHSMQSSAKLPEPHAPMPAVEKPLVSQPVVTHAEPNLSTKLK